MIPFDDRRDAGRQLAARLQEYADTPDGLVLGLPRGGVPVAFEVANSLRLPLDVYVVRKLGAPGQEDLAIGAIASGGITVLNDEVVYNLHLPASDVAKIIKRETIELERRESAYRGERGLPNINGKTILLIDDGLATGATMRAAVRAIRRQGPARLVVAVPVSAEEVCDQFVDEADDLVCGWTPRPFLAVGYWYRSFAQITDDEVHYYLDKARANRHILREPLKSRN